MQTIKSGSPTLELQKDTRLRQKSINHAIGWLLNSKIHNLDETDKETFGSFNDYYDLRKKRCSYAYTEITAYAVELLLDLYDKTKDKRYLHNAKLAGEWISKMQCKQADDNAIGGFLECLYLPNGPRAQKVYSFDTAICIGALSDLYRKTGDNRFLRAADKGVQWLIHVMRNSDGSFKPFYDLRTKSFSSKSRGHFSYRPKSAFLRNTWFKLRGCHHGKNAIGLLKYYSIKKKSLLLEIVRRLSQWVLALQDREGCFRVNAETKASFMHTHCYATEGLLYSYPYLKDRQLFNAGKKACDWLVKIQRSDGSIPSWFNNRQIILSVDSSAVAQAVRLWSIFYSRTGDERYFDSIKKASKYLLSMQHDAKSESTMLAGFYLVEFNLRLIKYRLKRLYSWATLFAIHALDLADSILSRKIQESELW